MALSTDRNTLSLSSKLAVEKLAVEKLAVETGQGSMLMSIRATLAVRTSLCEGEGVRRGEGETLSHAQGRINERRGRGGCIHASYLGHVGVVDHAVTEDALCLMHPQAGDLSV